MEHAAPKNAGPAVAGDKASAKSIPGKPPVIGFVIPCYNEQAALPHLLARLNADLDRLIAAKEVAAESYILIVDDGSRDRTWTLVEEAVQAQPQRVQGLKLSRNVGHQNALLAGLLTQIDKTDATISLDADLQDDVSVLGTMIEHFRNGAEVVRGAQAAHHRQPVQALYCRRLLSPPQLAGRRHRPAPR
jgi:cellulose synthase/poly-beta-1,6-N-acetylglucosamine synthase-like glycosyltransferase